MRFRENQDVLPLFTKVYEQLKSKGLPFPDESKVNPLKDVGGSSASTSASAASNVVTFKKPLDAKHRKLRKDLEVVVNNVILGNEMIDAVQPGDDVSQDEALKDVVGSIRTMENKLMDLIGKVKNEDMMNFCLLLNDDVQKTIQRYERVERGQRAGRFERQCKLENEEVKESMPDKPINLPLPGSSVPQRSAPPSNADVDLLGGFDAPSSTPAPSQPPPPKEEPKPQSLNDIFEQDFGGLQGSAPAAQPSGPDKISELNNIMEKMNLEKSQQEQHNMMQQQMQQQMQ